jgi:hypothetical protein
MVAGRHEAVLVRGVRSGEGQTLGGRPREGAYLGRSSLLEAGRKDGRPGLRDDRPLTRLVALQQGIFN